METLFSRLAEAMNGAPPVVLAAAFGWGILSVLLSPCHLAGIPLVVGFLHRGETVSARRAAVLSGLFALGVLASIALIGGVTAAAGRLLGDLGPWSAYAVAAVFFAFGMNLLGLLPLPEGWLPAPRQRWRGPGGAVLFGAVFGAALGPCTFGFMAPVLGVVFESVTAAPGFAHAVLAVFGLGHCAVIAIAGASSAWVRRWLAWQDGHSGVSWMRRVCGILVLAGGAWLLVGAAG